MAKHRGEKAGAAQREEHKSKDGQANGHTKSSVVPCISPLLDLSVKAQEMLVHQHSSNSGTKGNVVVDVLPCSSLQEGVLLSSSPYVDSWIWRCVPCHSEVVDPLRLEMAWKTVTNRHKIFSTIFSPHPEGDGFLQMVFNKEESTVSQLTALSDSPVLILKRLEAPHFAADKPKHSFTICRSEVGEVACRLDISHALYDAYTISILLEELSEAYERRPLSYAKQFSEIIKHIKAKSESESMDYWTTVLTGTQGCLLPGSSVPHLATSPQNSHGAIILPREAGEKVTQFCKANNITRSVFMHISWALMLNYYTGIDDVCFGYMASGRDAPVDGIRSICGPIANMLFNRIDLRTHPGELLRSVTAALKSHKKYQHASLATLEHRLGISGGHLFNTMISLLRADAIDSHKKQGFTFEKHAAMSSHEFDLVLEGYLNPSSIGITVHYREAFVTYQTAQEMCHNFISATNFLISTINERHMDLPSDSGRSSRAVSPGSTEPGGLSEDFFQDLIGVDKISTEAFWRGQFANMPDLRFPMITEKRRESLERHVLTSTLRASEYKSTVPLDLIARAAWSIIISQATDSNDVSFGSFATRALDRRSNESAEADSLAFAVPIRVKLDWDASINHFLLALQKQDADLKIYAGTGAHWLSQLSSECAMVCKFQSFFMVQRRDRQNGCALDPRHTKTQQDSECPLAMNCVLEENKITFHLTFEPDIGLDWYVKRLMYQFENVFQKLAGSMDGHERLKDTISVPPKELKDIWAWNADAWKPKEESVHTLFKSQVLAHPEKLAINGWDGDLTYSQLDALSTQLAHILLNMGVGPGYVVPLCFEKSFWMPVAMLGVMKTGAASVGIDPKQPEARLRSITDQVQATVILTSSSKRNLALLLDIPKIVVVSEVLEKEFPMDHLCEGMPIVKPSQLLYAVFTSGSTGTPKGVLITHRSYSTAVTHQHKPYGFTSGSRVLDFSSYAFDAVWYNVLHTLTSGGCLCIASDEELQNDLTGCLRKYDITLVFLTPSVCRQVDFKLLVKLDSLLIGGEMVTEKDVSSVGENTQVKIMYGPSECTPMTMCYDLPPKGNIAIGRGVGVCTWVVDSEDPSRLVSIGSVGELWLEGPLVGQGYLQDEEKTSASFIRDPTWLKQGSQIHPGRSGILYRTGDLVRYTSDGILDYVRRKDTQVKIRGQRVELAEVEKHVQDALEDTLNRGSTRLRVIAEMIQPEEIGGAILVTFIAIDGASDLENDDLFRTVKSIALELTECLSCTVPIYMVPSAFIPIREVPMSITSKTDRAALRRQGISSWREYRAAASNNCDVEASTNIERLLQEVWASVLNIPAKTISTNRDFTRLGGDSITAMQVASKCRGQNISVSVGNILRARTIKQLAPLCEKISAPSSVLVDTRDESEFFRLSPIQQKFFALFPEGLDHFNQTFVLDINRALPVETLHNAVQAVVSRHSMLRARYVKRANCKWEQFVAEDSPQTFGFEQHKVFSRSSILEIAQERQSKLNILDGPVFAVDCFNVAEGKQVLVLSAHHLVVDLVSWRIIWTDLEDYVNSGCLPTIRAPSFRKWCTLQHDTFINVSPHSVLPFHIPSADFAFWGALSCHNTRGDSEDYTEKIDFNVTALLMGKCNEQLRTSPLDVILGSYAHSFRQVFPERIMPAIFLEGHGREESELLPFDVSETVGWFTTIYPTGIDLNTDSTIVEAVRLAKDMRHNVPGNGQPYFASRCYSDTCFQAFEGHDQIELLLNFAGRYQQLEGSERLFNLAEPFEDGKLLEVVSKSSRRLALVETFITIEDGKLNIKFTVNKHMDHQHRLKLWFKKFAQTLESAVHSLCNGPSGLTLSDIPLLSLSYRGLDRLLRQQLPAMGVRTENVVDIYSASPLQEGILLSSDRGTSSYSTYWIWTCVPKTAFGSISALRLQQAWHKVVNRHPMLCTVFSPHPEASGFIQIVIAGAEIDVRQITIKSGSPSKALSQLQRPEFAVAAPKHTFTICQSDQMTACRLDINHTLLDGASLTPLIRDLVLAYDDCIVQQSPSFKEAIRHIQSIPKKQKIAFWASFLQDVKPCEITTSSTPQNMSEDIFTYTEIREKTTAGISNFCKTMEITRFVFLQIAWSLVLSQLTGMHEVCFGYLASGRNAPIANIESIIGPMANMLISRINLKASATDIYKKASEDSIKHMEHQHTPLAEIQHAVGLSAGARLFNTAITVRAASQFESGIDRSISLRYEEHADQHEFDLLLSGFLSGESTQLSIQTRDSVISHQLREEITILFTQAIHCLISKVDQRIYEDEIYPINSSPQNCLYCDFCYYTLGTDETSALGFWRNSFDGLLDSTAYFPTLRAVAPTTRPRDNYSFEVKDIPCIGDATSTIVKIRGAWAIVASHESESSEAIFGISSVTTHLILPCRLVLNWKASGNDLLYEVQRQMTEMRIYERCPLLLIRRASDEAATACGVQSVLVVQTDDDECQVPMHAVHSQAMVIQCKIDTDGLKMMITYDPEITQCSNIARLAARFEHAFRWLGDTLLRESEIQNAAKISIKELNEIWSWNVCVPEPISACIPDLVKESLLLDPQATAINAWDGSLTYAQLDEISTSIACRLIHMGVIRRMTVPLLFEKSLWMPVAMLAVAKTGAASVALDVTQPEEHLSAILQHTGRQVLLTSVANKELANRLQASSIVVIDVNQLCETTVRGDSQEDLPRIQPSDILYVVFTSGSTGTPKGVKLTHSNICGMAKYQQTALGITKSSRIYDFASYAFDVAWCNFVHALTSGGCLCIPSESDKRNRIEDSMVELRANYAHITPTLLRHLDWSKISTISVLNLSGEPVVTDDRRLTDRKIKVINVYGPAETNVVTLQELNGLPEGQVSIGRGFGACTWVVDTTDPCSLAPIGSVGELWIEGPLVGAGYLGDASRTARAFVKDPEWLLRGTETTPGRKGVLYRTGDLVRYKDDGSLAYVGRMDRQVKIRGQRLELGEVESHVRRALLRLSTITARGIPRINAEILRTHQTDKVTLAALITLSEAECMTEEQHDNTVRNATAGLSDFLHSTLPTYMVPSVCIPIKKIPLTATGKTDRRKLQALGESKLKQEMAHLGNVGTEKRQPKTDVECMLQKLWAEVLQMSPDSVHADDSFFQLGGDSLGAMRLASLTRDAELPLTVKEIFEAPVLHELSSLVSSRRSSQDEVIYPFSLLNSRVDPIEACGSAAHICNVENSQILDILPCTPLQNQLFGQIEIGVAKQASTHVLEVRRDIDLQKLRQTWEQVVAENPILRTRIINIPNQGYVQAIIDGGVEWICGDNQKECEQYLDQNPMGQGTPLVRLAILESSETCPRRFIWNIHWAVYDGWSIRLLLAEVEKTYYNCAEQPLEDMLGFSKHIANYDDEQLSAYWRHQFTGLEGRHFPQTPAHSETREPNIDQKITHTIRGLDWSAGDFTPATIIRAALALVIGLNLESNEALFGATVTGRQAAVPGIERMVGPAFTTVPIRVALDWQTKGKALLRKVQNQSTDMIPFEQAGLERIRQASDEALMASNFQLLLVIQSLIKSGDVRYREHGQQVFVDDFVASDFTIVELGQRFGKYPLFLECKLGKNEEVLLSFCADSTLLRRNELEHWLKQLEFILRQLSDTRESEKRLTEIVEAFKATSA